MIEGKINLDQFNAFIDLATIGYTIECLNFTCSGDKIRARLKGIGVFSDVEVDNFIDAPTNDYEFTLKDVKTGLRPYLNVFKDTDVELQCDEYVFVMTGNDGYKCKLKLHDPEIANEFKMQVDELPGEIIYESTQEETQAILSTIKDFRSINKSIYFNFVGKNLVLSCEDKNAHTSSFQKTISDRINDVKDISFEFSKEEKGIYKFLRLVDDSYTIKIRKTENYGKVGAIISFDKEGISLGLASSFHYMDK